MVLAILPPKDYNELKSAKTSAGAKVKIALDDLAPKGV
jgi:hypothetical protein